MLLNYARSSVPQCRRGLAVLTGAAGVLCGAVAIWCAAHTVHVVSGEREAGNTFCGTCYQSMIAALGMPLHHSLALGVLSGGCAIVAGIQTIRWVNAARAVD
jgi:hypothetical protein